MPKKTTKTAGALPELSWFQGRAQLLADNDKERNEVFSGIDKLVNLIWEVPKVLADLQWVRPQRELFFRQIVQAATRILADAKVRIRMLSYDRNDRGKVDSHENVLKWQLHAASRRRAETILHDMSESAVRYAMIIQQVIYLPEQIKAMSHRGSDTNRIEAIQRKSPYVVVTHTPANAHPRFSDYGLEEISVDRPVDPEELLDLFGEDSSEELKMRVRATDSTLSEVVLREYVSHHWHAIWAEWGPIESTSSNMRANTYEFLREKWTWNFLPFVVRLSGSNLDREKKYQVRPLLGDAHHGDQFDLLNRVKTLRFSEMLRFAGSPKKYFQSDSRKRPDMDVTSADLMVRITSEEKIGALEPAIPDPSLGQLYAELRSDQQRSTLSELLMGGEVPSGAAFASLNLMTHSAMAVLKPARELIQSAVADLLEIFLLYAHYSQAPLTGFGMTEEQRGKRFQIKPQEINPANLFVDVDLSADLPTDRQARMITAQAGIAAGIISRKQAREDVGITDNQEVEEDLLSERWMAAFQEIDIENERFMASTMARQTMREQVLMELQKNPQMLQQIMGESAKPPGGAPPEGGAIQPGPLPPGEGGGQAAESPETGIPGSDLLQPGVTGAIPAELAPNATRELQMNRTKSGEEIAQV